ncbi:MAG: glycosyltransferase [Isosphaeraceae bacterium]
MAISRPPAGSGDLGSGRPFDWRDDSSNRRVLPDPHLVTDRVPLVSACMPVYNGERYLAEAVESILAQTLVDFEFLIIDDGSTDGSLRILQRYAEQDPRIRLISRPNKGLTATLNELIDLARGEFIARMDADDVSLPERLERQVDYLRANPGCVVVGCRALVIDPDGDPVSVRFNGLAHEELDAQNLDGSRQSALCHPSVLMRRQALVESGKYRQQFQYCEDLDLWLRMAERGRLGNLPEVLIKYRVHEDNKSNHRVARSRDDFWQVLTEARQRRGLPVGQLPPGPRGSEGRPDESIHRTWGWQALMGGFVSTARKHAWKFLRQEPFSIDAWKLLKSSLIGY